MLYSLDDSAPIEQIRHVDNLPSGDQLSAIDRLFARVNDDARRRDLRYRAFVAPVPEWAADNDGPEDEDEPGDNDGPEDVYEDDGLFQYWEDGQEGSIYVEYATFDDAAALAAEKRNAAELASDVRVSDLLLLAAPPLPQLMRAAPPPPPIVPRKPRPYAWSLERWRDVVGAELAAVAARVAELEADRLPADVELRVSRCGLSCEVKPGRPGPREVAVARLFAKRNLCSDLSRAAGQLASGYGDLEPDDLTPEERAELMKGPATALYNRVRVLADQVDRAAFDAQEELRLSPEGWIPEPETSADEVKSDGQGDADDEDQDRGEKPAAQKHDEQGDADDETDAEEPEPVPPAKVKPRKQTLVKPASSSPLSSVFSKTATPVYVCPRLNRQGRSFNVPGELLAADDLHLKPEDKWRLTAIARTFKSGTVPASTQELAELFGCSSAAVTQWVAEMLARPAASRMLAGEPGEFALSALVWSYFEKTPDEQTKGRSVRVYVEDVKRIKSPSRAIVYSQLAYLCGERHQQQGRKWIAGTPWGQPYARQGDESSAGSWFRISAAELGASLGMIAATVRTEISRLAKAGEIETVTVDRVSRFVRMTPAK